ncbi:hypothetical protein [Sphingomonas sp. So64.6b]|nr:hypothetical protein [Sphingomonas sp. So64.6b]
MDKIQQTIATEAKPVWTAPVIDVVSAQTTAGGAAVPVENLTSS